ncbi:hypothetical protein AVEN_139608-1 [Araneus ventricosus]|uniref:DUF4817 domain-containing protein n=1 Tax=Araneus ventricosus TaxID=182803 RepID=A0A4Y2JFE8_ARAVE|nr:hypothetical protein AVEN_139608-1 [Araneus ventricosus]
MIRGTLDFFPLKNDSNSKRKRVLRRHTETFYTNQASNKHLAGNGFVIRQHVIVTRSRLLVKLFYRNGESTTIALRNFRTEEELKAHKSTIY